MYLNNVLHHLLYLSGYTNIKMVCWWKEVANPVLTFFHLFLFSYPAGGVVGGVILYDNSNRFCQYASPEKVPFSQTFMCKQELSSSKFLWPHGLVFALICIVSSETLYHRCQTPVLEGRRVCWFSGCSQHPWLIQVIDWLKNRHTLVCRP